MSNDTKILLCLWIAFLLSMVIPLHAQRGISRGNVTFNVNSSNAFSTYAFVWGDLDAGVYTEPQKKTIRRQNYIYFKQVIQDAKLNNTCLDFPGNTLQLHLLPNDEIVISDEQIVCLTGVDKKSKIDFYPKALIRGNPAKVFKMEDGGSIAFKNIHFLGSGNNAHPEVYSGVLRLSSDYTKIKIQDTTQIRVGFWHSSLVGAKVGIKHSSTNTVAKTYTIASFDSTSRVITLSGAGIDFTVTDDFSDAGTLLAFHWNSDEIHPDTVSRYGRNFMIDETSSSHQFIYGAIGEGNFANPAYIKIDNCRIENFQVGIYVSGGWLDYYFDNSYFQGDEIAITKYNGIGYGNPSTIHMNRCEIAYSGMVLIANALAPSSQYNDDLLWGSGAYNHPSTRVVLNDCYIHDNYTGAFRQFSDGSEKSSPNWFASYFINCTFRNNAEYHLLTSNTHRTVIQNCTFDNGNVMLTYSTDVENTLLLNSYVNLYSYANAQPKPDSDTTQLRLNFNHVKFYKYSYFKNGWSSRRSKRTTINFDNCDFELSIITAYYNQKIRTGSYVKININNAYLFNRNTVTHPDIVSYTTSGTQLQGFLHYGHDVKLYANNIQYDTFRNSIPLIPQNRDDFISGKISNSRLLGVDGQYSQTGSNYGLVLENVEYPYTSNRITRAYNFKSGVDRIATVSIGTNNIGGTSYTKSVWLTSAANTYLITNSDSLRYVFWGARSITTDAAEQKYHWVGYSGTIRIIADTSFCITTGGNIRLTSPVCYNEGDVIELKYFPFIPNNETKTTVRDSTLANGTSVNFQKGTNAKTKNYKPGLCKVYIDGTLVGSDNMNERVTGATVSGYVGYLTDRYNIFFTTPPANGSYVIVERVSVSQGIWKIE